MRKLTDMLERINNKNMDESTTGRYCSTQIVKKRRRGKRKKKDRKALAVEGGS